MEKQIVELHIPGFAIAYNSHTKTGNVSNYTFTGGVPKSIQASDLPQELQDQIAEWLKNYEANRLGLIDETIEIKFVMGVQ